MGKASRTKTDTARRERIAAQRAAQRRRERRQRLLMAGGAILAVVVVVVGLVVWKTTSGGSSSGASNGPTGTALASVVKDVTSVPASTSDAVGAGGSTLSGSSAWKSVSGTALTSNGKPEVLYVGAEYCPFCAANRWAMIAALSRFGTFTGLRTIHSSSSDNPANVPTWTFHGSTYTSNYIVFSSVEETTNVINPATNYYYTLETPTAAQQAVVTQYEGTGGSIPFISFGNKYIQTGDLPMLSPSNLTGDWTKIASDLANPSSSNAKAVLSAANFMTAAICKLTNNQPASACTSTIQGLQSQL